MSSRIEQLPIEAHVDQFVADLADARSGIVVASPGAGKTSIVPVRLACASWLSGSARPHIIVVQPRRVAALQAAQRLAASFNESVGQRVGLRMRGDTRVSARTLITVVTEGVFLRMIRTDPMLENVGVVILDEFHERSLDVDIACALCISTRELFVPELRIVVMSATLDVDAVSALLQVDGPIAQLHADGARFPVEVVHVPAGSDARIEAPGRSAAPTQRVSSVSRWGVSPAQRAAEHASRVAIRHIETDPHDRGDILVFLPGIHEIRVASRLLSAWVDTRNTDLLTVEVLELHGRSDARSIERSLATGTSAARRIVLSTSIAQTSVTIDGVTLVIDAGFTRAPIRDRDTGMSRLGTIPISQATANQRSGRAGRTRPGKAVRLWSNAEHMGRPSHDHPAIAEEDLSPLVLLLAVWGQSSQDLRWCDPPDETALQDGRRILRSLGAIDGAGAVTALGNRLADIPAHPRLASMLDRASQQQRTLAAAIVSLLSDADPWRSGRGPVDLKARLHRIFDSEQPLVDGPGNPRAIDSYDDQAGRGVRRAWKSLIGQTGHEPIQGFDSTGAGFLLLFAYPDRIAVRLLDRSDRYRFASGLVLDLALDETESNGELAGCRILVACDLDADRRAGRIRVGVAVTIDEIRAWVSLTAGSEGSPRLVEELGADWEVDTAADGSINAYTMTVLELSSGRLELFRTKRTPTASDRTLAAVAEFGQRGVAALVWDESSRQLAARLRLAHATAPEEWPELDDQHLVNLVIERLKSGGSGGSGGSRRSNGLQVKEALSEFLALSPGAYRLDQLVPTTIQLRAEVNRTVRYIDEHGNEIPPTVRTRLQDLFGVAEHPHIFNGRVPIKLELVSPANRPVAITDDIKRFWVVGYPNARSDLRGRYPKHHWPEDPTTATPRQPSKGRP